MNEPTSATRGRRAAKPAAPRKQTPLLLQLEAVECGARSAGHRAGALRTDRAAPALREACGVSRDGSKASNVMKAAWRYGLKAKAFRRASERDGPRDAVYRVLELYFLVVEGFDVEIATSTTLARSPQGEHKAFDESFTGVIIVLEPEKDFQPGGAQPSLVEGVKSRIMGAKEALKYLLIMALVLPVARPDHPGVHAHLPRQRARAGHGLVQAGDLRAARDDGVRLPARSPYVCLQRLKIHLSASMSRTFLQHLLRLPLRYCCSGSRARSRRARS